jgi:ribosomal protein S18 acetylase RimI-like enzyme
VSGAEDNQCHLLYRQTEEADIPGMARLRASRWGEAEYWKSRISQYLKGELNPQQALAPRVCYVAVDGSAVVGLVAGHLTRRHACDGELEWIDVILEQRRSGVASELLRLLARWFVQQGAFRICVNVDPSNAAARAFYIRNGAGNLNEYWLVWNDISSVLGDHLV